MKGKMRQEDGRPKGGEEKRTAQTAKDEAPQDGTGNHTIKEDTVRATVRERGRRKEAAVGDAGAGKNQVRTSKK